MRGFSKFLAMILMPLALSLSANASKSVLKKKESEIVTIKRKLSQKEELIKRLKSKEVSILSTINELDVRLYGDRKKLKDLSGQKENVSEEIKKISKEIQTLESKIRMSRKDVSSVLRASYKMGNAGFVKILLASEDYSDFMRKKYYLAALVKRQNDMISAYGRDQDSLIAKMNELSGRRDLLETITTDISGRLKSLSRTKSDKLSVLKAIKGERELELKNARELSRAAQDLERVIKRIVSRGTGSADFELSKGSLELPLKGRVTQGYGSYRDRSLDVDMFSKGLNIEVRSPTPVKTVFDGEVIYAGVFRGYGNIIIVDHGRNYYSLYSRLDSLTKGVGEKVKEGDQLGTVGEYGGSSCYFEIRHNGQAVDPSPWLSKR